MTLEDTINELWKTGNKRNKRATRQATLNALTEQLTTQHDQALTYEQLRTLDNTAHRLKTLPQNHLYRNAIERIDDIRKDYRNIGPSTANNILTTKGTTYTTRIAEVHHYLDNNTATYDDLRLLEHTLTKNQYLRRRAKNPCHQEEQEQLLTKVRNAIKEQEPQHQPYNTTKQPQGILHTYYSPIKRRIAQSLIAMSAAAITIAATPTTILAGIYHLF